MNNKNIKNICFVTGTRAEFGLMESTLRAIQRRADLRLQIIATGMHLDRRHGKTVDSITGRGWKVDAVVPWGRADHSQSLNARNTGLAMAGLAEAYEKLKTDIVLVVGDRVEAFAAASAAHISHRILAHVHGGDRALGQVDDALRHAITKLAHVHFPATQSSADRILKLGEDPWRIHCVGSPGLDGIRESALDAGKLRAQFPELRPRRFALLILHPATADEQVEYDRAKTILRAVESVGFNKIIIVNPNNDPGSAGIIRCWKELAGGNRFIVRPDLDRPTFLGLMRDAAALIGNSSSGIIEAASFSTPVLDIGPRQMGRERSENVANLPYQNAPIRRKLEQLWNNSRPIRPKITNVYGRGGAGKKIASILDQLKICECLRHKLIVY